MQKPYVGSHVSDPTYLLHPSLLEIHTEERSMEEFTHTYTHIHTHKNYTYTHIKLETYGCYEAKLTLRASSCNGVLSTRFFMRGSAPSLMRHAIMAKSSRCAERCKTLEQGRCQQFKEPLSPSHPLSLPLPLFLPPSSLSLSSSLLPPPPIPPLIPSYT